jgi:TonB family protein
MKRMFSVGILFLLTCVLLRAQAPVPLESSITPPQSLNHPEPDYPPIAAAAHVYGTVIIQATVDVEGNVSAERVVSGPPMLQQAALDAVRLRNKSRHVVKRPSWQINFPATHQHSIRSRLTFNTPLR